MIIEVLGATSQVTVSACNGVAYTIMGVLYRGLVWGDTHRLKYADLRRSQLSIRSYVLTPNPTCIREHGGGRIRAQCTRGE